MKQRFVSNRHDRPAVVSMVRNEEPRSDECVNECMIVAVRKRIERGIFAIEGWFLERGHGQENAEDVRQRGLRARRY